MGALASGLTDSLEIAHMGITAYSRFPGLAMLAEVFKLDFLGKTCWIMQVEIVII